MAARYSGKRCFSASTSHSIIDLMGGQKRVLLHRLADVMSQHTKSAGRRRKLAARFLCGQSVYVIGAECGLDLLDIEKDAPADFAERNAIGCCPAVNGANRDGVEFGESMTVKPWC